MKTTLRLITFFLTALLFFSSCTSSSILDNSTKYSVSGSELGEITIPETTADPNDRSHVQDNVPEGVTFNGSSIRIIMRGMPGTASHINDYETVGTDNLGDYVTDGVWQRNRLVEERLGIVMDIAGLDGNRADVAKQIQSLVMAGSDEYDYIHSSGNTNINQGLNPYLRDLAYLPYVDYDAVWWWDDINRAVSLDGQSYHYIFGDMLIFCYMQTGVVYYNKMLYENIFGNPDEMYTTVMDGKWTIDRLTELTSAAYADVNGDGIPNVGDTFGSMKSATQVDELPHFLQGFDLQLYTRDTEGNLIIDYDMERCALALEKLGKYNTSTEGVFHSEHNIDDGSGAYFVQNYSVFFPARLARVISADFRNMEAPYGILPYPKLDEEQKDYRSLVHLSSTNISVPKTVSDTRMEIIGAWLECIAAESYRSVMPQFLEMALKLKYSQDSMSGQVIDIVVAGVSKNTLDEFGIYSADIFTQTLVNGAKSGSNNLASAYRKLASAAQKIWNDNVTKLIQTESADQ